LYFAVFSREYFILHITSIVVVLKKQKYRIFFDL